MNKVRNRIETMAAIRNVLMAVAVTAGVLFAQSASAAIVLFDIGADPAGWAAAIAGKTASTAYDFNADADYGIVGITSPLTSAGDGPVSAGNLATGVVMDRIDLGGGLTPGLVAVGPLAGFGNADNAILANVSSDDFKISFAAPVEGFEFNALTLSGAGGTVDIRVHDDVGGSTDFLGVAVGDGRKIGLLGTGGMNIVGVELSDPDLGFEGVQGHGLVYAAAVPEPGTLALLGLGLAGVAASRRRRG